MLHVSDWELHFDPVSVFVFAISYLEKDICSWLKARSFDPVCFFMFKPIRAYMFEQFFAWTKPILTSDSKNRKTPKSSEIILNPSKSPVFSQI